MALGAILVKRKSVIWAMTGSRPQDVRPD